MADLAFSEDLFQLDRVEFTTIFTLVGTHKSGVYRLQFLAFNVRRS